MATSIIAYMIRTCQSSQGAARGRNQPPSWSGRSSSNGWREDVPVGGQAGCCSSTSSVLRWIAGATKVIQERLTSRGGSSLAV